MRNLKSMLLGAVALASLALPAAAQVTVKIGVLSDMSSLYADLGGAGSVAAARMAVEDFNAAAKGMRVEIVSADHQNRADVVDPRAFRNGGEFLIRHRDIAGDANGDARPGQAGSGSTDSLGGGIAGGQFGKIQHGLDQDEAAGLQRAGGAPGRG
jgi:hypothetical protein